MVTGNEEDIFEAAESNLSNAGLTVKNRSDAAKIHSGIDEQILGVHARMHNPQPYFNCISTGGLMLRS
jgi:hypothetical protein